MRFDPFEEAAMIRRVALWSPLLTLALTAPAAAQVQLQWKFKEGEKFYLEEKFDNKSSLIFGCTPVKQDQKQYRVWSFVVKQRNADGSAVLDVRIERWKYEATGGMAGGEKAFEIMEPIFKQVPWTAQISAEGKMTRFDGYDQLLKKLAEAGPDVVKVFKGLANEEVFRMPLAMVFDVLPGIPAKPGASWKRVTYLSIGLLGGFTHDHEFTYVGPGDGGHKITFKGKYAFQPTKADAIAVLGLKILKMEPKKNESTGKILFDNANGRLTYFEITMPLDGKMTLEVGGGDMKTSVLEMEMEGTETRTIRIFDQKPAEK
jgi:hypothetical protein